MTFVDVDRDKNTVSHMSAAGLLAFRAPRGERRHIGGEGPAVDVAENKPLRATPASPPLTLPPQRVYSSVTSSGFVISYAIASVGCFGS